MEFKTVVITCMAFVFIHSLMVSKVFKRVLFSLTGERFMKCYYRAIFVLLTPVLMVMVYFVVESLPDTYLFMAPFWLKWPMHLVQLSGMLFGMASLWVLDAAEYVGIKQAKRCLKENSPDLKNLSTEGLSEFKLVTSGVYSIIRHPIYLAGMIIISFQPTITYNWLMVTIIADIYFLYAAFKEEWLLLRAIDQQYREYRHRVPMFNLFKGIYNKLTHKKVHISEPIL